MHTAKQYYLAVVANFASVDLSCAWDILIMRMQQRPLSMMPDFCGKYASCCRGLLMADTYLFLCCFDSSTGDQVIMREDGNIYVVDRLKHIIKNKVRSRWISCLH